METTNLNSFFKMIEDDLHSNQNGEPVKKEPVTFWIPTEYKEKFSALQSKSQRKFGRRIAELIMMSIDKVAK
jgi:hypothetical protein